jgi:alkylhydroperoxidase family enzyme
VRALGDENVVKAALADPETAPISDKLRVTLRFLEKLTLSPDALTTADLEPLRAAGLDDAAIESAMYVAFVFNVIDRLADAFDFTPNDARGLKIASMFLLKAGYTATVVPG